MGLKIWHLVTIAAIGALLIVFIGTTGEKEVEQRARDAISDPTLVGRVGAWKDSLLMLRDFPLFGVGLGCWSEIFPHYESPPWPADSFWAQPHNDYLQIVAETGIIGLLMVGWLVGWLFRPVLAAARRPDMRAMPFLAGIVGSAVAVAIEEFVDFGLQVPANALIFTVLLALSLRAVEHPELKFGGSGWRSISPSSAALLAALTVILGTVAMARPLYAGVSYDPRTALEARAFILAHPAQLDAHISLLELFGRSMAPDRFRAEVETAVWLDPANPYARDLHAIVLMRQEDRQIALSEITRSLLFSPLLSTHAFLFSANRPLSSLPSDERGAIRAGLAKAVARGYQDSAQNLGDFYNAVGQPGHAVAIYDAAAATEPDLLRKSAYLVEAGESATAAKNLDQAEREFEKAISAEPQSATPYQQLIDLMFRKKDPTAAQRVLDRARQNSIDPFAFYLQLATDSRDLLDLAPAESNALKAVSSHPADPEAVQVLGTIYLAENKYSQAATAFQRLCELEPKAAEAFFYLGAAEEGDYHWSAAEEAFQRALTLDPRNGSYKARYDQFETKLARNKTDRTVH